MGKKKKQPLGIILNAVVWMLVGLLTILGAIGLAAFGALGLFAGLVVFSAFLGGMAIILFLLGCVEMVLAWGLWNHKAWAWWITVIIGFFGIGSIALSLLLVSAISVIPAVISIVLLILLFRKDVLKAIDTGIAYKGW